jgi:ubiquinone/menaquinone biosynthesis C-methylase UbiE
VTTFGVLDHLKNVEAAIAEAHRVLRSGGHLVVSTTNLSSWVNRIALLLGYQPRNLEISKKELFGVHESYRQLYGCTDTLGRISSFTLRAFEEMLRFYGFRILREWGARLIPKPDRDPAGIIGAVDMLLSKRPSLAVRYLVFCEKF